MKAEVETPEENTGDVIGGDFEPFVAVCCRGQEPEANWRARSTLKFRRPRRLGYAAWLNVLWPEGRTSGRPWRFLKNDDGARNNAAQARHRSPWWVNPAVIKTWSPVLPRRRGTRREAGRGLKKSQDQVRNRTSTFLELPATLTMVKLP
ncbi:hypothetical protein [Enterobacter hormaechei]|uniref:hypothetical protein n=1 Tax=Enterobacter hormaechei TaxID=158836 RepID=UPI0039B08F01